MEFTFQRKYIENNQKRGYLNRNYLYTWPKILDRKGLMQISPTGLGRVPAFAMIPVIWLWIVVWAFVDHCAFLNQFIFINPTLPFSTISSQNISSTSLSPLIRLKPVSM
jgi:hypothetical protein